jgi:hypothetical protein
MVVRRGDTGRAAAVENQFFCFKAVKEREKSQLDAV